MPEISRFLGIVMTCIREAKYVDGYRLSVLFDTGEAAIVDFSDLLASNSAAEPLKNLAEFKAFFLDGWPTLAWPCGFDIAPETLYQMATGKLPAWVNQHADAEEVC